MENVKINYKILINAGRLKGEEIEFSTSINELEEENLSTILIEKDYLTTWCNASEYTVLSRQIEIIDNKTSIKGSVPLSELQEFFYDMGEDWHLWDEAENGPYPVTRTLDAFKKFFEEMKLRHNQ